MSKHTSQLLTTRQVADMLSVHYLHRVQADRRWDDPGGAYER